MSLSGKVALVTGAASGIGAALAVSFAREQARLCLVDINEQRLRAVSERCHQHYDTEVLEVLADLRADDDLDKIVNCALKELGKIDVLINCAGIYKGTNLQDENIMDSFDEIIAVNLKTVIAMTKKALPALIENKGCVINISSIATGVISSGGLIYSMAKAGVKTFTKCTAFELARLGVRVNCISPGAVRTNLFLNAGLSDEENRELWDHCADIAPLQRCVKAEEVAEMAVYLASDKAANITGADFVVDAGMMLGTVGAPLILNPEEHRKQKNKQ